MNRVENAPQKNQVVAVLRHFSLMPWAHQLYALMLLAIAVATHLVVEGLQGHQHRSQVVLDLLLHSMITTCSPEPIEPFGHVHASIHIHSKHAPLLRGLQQHWGHSAPRQRPVALTSSYLIQGLRDTTAGPHGWSRLG